MEIDVSVIVPVYNVENYLNKCIDSVLKQTYSNYELILVDDGSTDNSGDICEFYEQKDERIKVIHKNNGGLSDARNSGMEIAKGKYLMFLDSDDYIDKIAIEKLYKIANEFNLDIVEGRAYSVKEDKLIDNFITKGIEENKIYKGEDYALTKIKNHCFFAAVWLKLYKRKYIEKIGLKFKDKRLHEDEIWNPQVILNANRIMYVDYPFYYYDISRNSSIMNNISYKNIEAIMNNCYELSEFYRRKCKKKKSKNVFLNYIVKQYMMSSLKCQKDLNWYKEKRNLKFVFKNAKSIPMVCIALVYAISINFFIFIFKQGEKRC